MMTQYMALATRRSLIILDANTGITGKYSLLKIRIAVTTSATPILSPFRELPFHFPRPPEIPSLALARNEHSP